MNIRKERHSDALFLWCGLVDDVRTFQPPDGAEAWLEEMFAHTKTGKQDEILEEIRGLMAPIDLAKAA